jgi:hypothetical protein
MKPKLVLLLVNLALLAAWAGKFYAAGRLSWPDGH